MSRIQPRLPRLLLLCLAMMTLPWMGCGLRAKPPTPAAAPAAGPKVATPAPVKVLDPRALERLKQMSETLAAAKSYTFKSSSSLEVPARTGQFLTFFSDTDIAVRRPNQFRVDLSGDMADFRVVYDGTRVQALDPAKRLFAVIDAPGTIDATLQFLDKKMGIRFHSSDLMVSDPYAVMSQGLTSALLVGTAKVDGVACEHLAFRGPGINWEVWVESGRTALPRRLAVTYTDAANFPRFLVTIRDWNLNAKFGPDEFTLKKPADAKQIEFGAAARLEQRARQQPVK